MLISTRGRYALRVLADLAERQAEEPLSVKELARQQGISEKYLESIVQILVKGNLLTSEGGKCGGCRFARPPEEITAWEVLSLTEGSLAAVGCHWEGDEACQRMEECRPLPLWRGLNRVIREYLTGCTVADLARNRESSGGASGEGLWN